MKRCIMCRSNKVEKTGAKIRTKDGMGKIIKCRDCGAIYVIPYRR